MKETVFTSGGVLKEAYKILKPKWKQVTLIFGVLMGTFLVLLDEPSVVGSAVLTTLFSYWSVVIVTKFTDNGHCTWNDLFAGFTFKKFALFFFTGFITCMAVLGGMLLLFVPAIIVLVQLYFVKFIAIEEDIAPLKVLHKSAELTKGYRWEIFEFFVISFLVNVLGALCLVVGLLFTIPLTMTATLLMYRKLVAAKKGEGEIVEATTK